MLIVFASSTLDYPGRFVDLLSGGHFSCSQIETLSMLPSAILIPTNILTLSDVSIKNPSNLVQRIS